MISAGTTFPITAFPFPLEGQRPDIKRTLARAGSVVTLAAQALADGFARHAGRACHDPDRHALPGQIDNLAIEGFAQLVAIPLDALYTGQGRRIDRPGRCQRAPQIWRCRTHRRPKCSPGVFEQVPAVGHLSRLRQCLAGAP